MTGLTEQLTLKTVQQTPYNAEAPLAALAQLPTATQLFYVRSNFEIPRLDLAAWRLRVTGAVMRPRDFSFGDLKHFESSEALVLLECAGNGRRRMVPVPSGVAWDLGAVGCALFRGVPLAALLGECGVARDAVEVLCVGADSGEVSPGRVVCFERSLPIDKALDRDVLLASAMNGAPLTPEHGYPVRLLVPRWYAVSSVKWLTEIRVLTEPFVGHFQTERYVFIDDPHEPDQTPVRELRVRALIAQPGDGETLRAGINVVRGAAWSGAAPIAKVHVSTDGGVAWHAAHLTQPRLSSAPALFSFEWDAPPGKHELMVRATDELGNTQPRDPIFNKLGYGNNLIQRLQVRVA